MDLAVDCSILPQDIFQTDLKDRNGYCKALLLQVRDRTLETIPKGEGRVKYLMSQEFLSTVSNHGYCLYNPKKNICVMDPDLAERFPDIFGNTCIYWTCLRSPEREVVLKLARKGFCHPYITWKTPDGRETGGVALVKQGDNKYSPEVVVNKIKGLRQGEGICKLIARFSSRAIELLRKLPEKGHTKNKDGTMSQKELTGELVITGADSKGYVIGVNEGSVGSGEEEDVSVSIVRYNFHSHPKEAYLRHSVRKAWPSVIDFLGFAKLGKRTIFHAVITLEGIYILSFEEHWAQNPEKIPRSFIQKHFNIPHPVKQDEKDIEKFLGTVNGITLEGHPIFNVFFLPWNKATSSFQVNFSGLGADSVCLISQDLVEIHKKL